MHKFKKNITLILCLISTLAYLPVHGQTMAAPSYATPTYPEFDIHSIKGWLEIDAIETNQSLLDAIFLNLQEKTEGEVLKELAKGLTINELEKLYKILVAAIDFEWTGDFAEKVWEARSLKIKLESPVLYGNPRIDLIAVSPGEQQFSMMLSDGSIWEVAGHLSGDPSVDLIIIRDLLGQYTEVEQFNVYNDYAYRISTLGFPEIRFNGYMLANKSSSLISENRDLYWFGQLYR